MSKITLEHRIACCSGCKYLKCTYLGEYAEFDRCICTRGYIPKNLYGVYECKEYRDNK